MKWEAIDALVLEIERVYKFAKSSADWMRLQNLRNELAALEEEFDMAAAA